MMVSENHSQMKDVPCGLLDLHHLLGKKWTYGLLFNLDEQQKSYTQIQSIAAKNINPTLLSNRLKQLVEFGILKREQEESRVYYSITQLGNELKKILHDLKKLSDKMDISIPHQCEGKDCSGCFSFRAEK